MDADITPAPLVDLEQIASRLGLPASLARTYLDTRYDYPVASYNGKPLWLSDTLHDVIAEREAVAERMAERVMRGEAVTS